MHTLKHWTAKRSGPALMVSGTNPDGREVKHSGLDVVTATPDGRVIATEGPIRASLAGRTGRPLVVELEVPGSRADLISRINGILDVGTGDAEKDRALAPAKISDIRMLLDSLT